MGGRRADAGKGVTRAVFLDRDGVLNEAIVRNGKPFSPNAIEEMVVVADALPALSALHLKGFRLVVVTNQPDIARGKLSRERVDAMNAHLCRMLPVDAIEVCGHDNDDGCDCRKPAPGMLLRAAQRDGIELAESFMVGDRWSDIEAGRRAHCRTVLIGDGYGEKAGSPADAEVANLRAAVDWIINQPIRRAG
jgi:D-glycero-D-manno-heptose 1,7-bisphosphate phosphatase